MSKELLVKIKELCKERNKSVTDLSLELGFSNSTIFRWETSEPSIDKVRAVADYFDVSTDYLIGITDIPTKIDNLYNDKELLAIQRFRSKLSDKDREKMRKILEIHFDEDFTEV